MFLRDSDYWPQIEKQYHERKDILTQNIISSENMDDIRKYQGAIRELGIILGRLRQMEV